VRDSSIGASGSRSLLRCCSRVGRGDLGRAGTPLAPRHLSRSLRRAPWSPRAARGIPSSFRPRRSPAAIPPCAAAQAGLASQASPQRFAKESGRAQRHCRQHPGSPIRGDFPKQTWVTDFTYIWTAEGWLYAAAVMDLGLALHRRLVDTGQHYSAAGEHGQLRRVRGPTHRHPHQGGLGSSEGTRRSTCRSPGRKT
jgi:transposase InsO family protein